nr:PREDICTED: lysophospholipid acyltransferase 2 isoform X2 [Megachile rotundata]
MTATVEDYYDGSRTFHWLGKFLDVPLDQFCIGDGVVLLIMRAFSSTNIRLCFLHSRYHRSADGDHAESNKPRVQCARWFNTIGEGTNANAASSSCEMPTPLEYFSFVFHFQALMAGPVIYYRDYMDFIHGRNLSKPRPSTANDQNSNDRNAIVQLPSPIFVVIKKVLASLLCALAFVIFIPLFPIDRLKDNDFLRDTSMFYKIRYLMIATMLVRFKYYHAWIFADAICNNSGLGFSGYDEKGKPQWDATSNVDVLGFEMSQSLKESIEHWNKGTNRWLRSLVYERVKHNKLVYTYVLSAIWHGFYPGYYLTFANGAFITVVSRVTRRKIRPYFLSSKATKFLYDTISFIVTRIVMAYITFSFVLLEFIPSIKVYLSLYMLPHIVGIAILLIAPRLPKVSSQTDTPETKSNASQELINGAARKSM